MGQFKKCTQCNKILEIHKFDISILLNAIKYLEENK